LNATCEKAPTSDACRNAVNAATQYIAMRDAWNVMRGDVTRSSRNTFDYVYNSPDAKQYFTLYYNTIDNRTNFFGATDQYEQNLGSGTQWFGGAKYVSETSLGAGDGFWEFLGQIKFAGGYIFGVNMYEWRAEAGDALMNAGFDSFRDLYNNGTSNPVAWDINQLRSEQQTLQLIHEGYLNWIFAGLAEWMTDTNKKNGMPGGINMLDLRSRIEYGCRLLGYSAKDGCSP